MPTARVRAITTAGAKKGSGVGEAARTVSQFQSFTVAFLQQHGYRILNQVVGSVDLVMLWVLYLQQC